MKNNINIFLLILIGTIGLLLNDFFFNWGRTTTLVFAGFNIIGLILLILNSKK